MKFTTLGKKEPYIGKEDNLQIMCAKYLRAQYPSLLWFHSPNGGNRNAIEGAKFKRMGVLRGVSDIVILQPNNEYKGLVIELKTKGNSVTKEQRAFLEQLSEYNWLCYVCYNFEVFKEVVDEYLKC